MSHYTPEPFKPDGGFSLVRLPILLLPLVSAAVFAGWLASFIGQWFYLIVIFPAAIGLMVFFAAVIGAKMAHLRNNALGLLFGIAGGLLAMLAMHYFDYLRFQSEQAALAQVAPQAAKKIDGFFSFLNAEATEGVTIGRQGGGFNIGYYGTWIYWSLETIAVMFCCVAGIFVTITDPYCTYCSCWKESKELGTLDAPGPLAREILENGDLDELQDHNPAMTGGDVVVSIAVCPRCREESSIAVKLEEKTKNEKGEESKQEVVHLIYPGEALADFEVIFDQPKKRRRRRRRVEEYDDEE